jgi:hypothetical protein
MAKPKKVRRLKWQLQHGTTGEEMKERKVIVEKGISKPKRMEGKETRDKR